MGTINLTGSGNSADNQMVSFAAGTYDVLITPSTPYLTIQGAQSGVDARTRTPSSESIVDGALIAPTSGSIPDHTTAFYIAVNNVTVDGFTISNEDAVYNFGAGIVMANTTSGVTVENNIITNNAIGLFADSAGASLVQHNLFDANNTDYDPNGNYEPSGGAAIYSDLTTSLTINANEFKNQTVNNPVIFAASDPTDHHNLSFTNNYLHDNSYGIYALSISGGLFQGNTITTTDPMSGIALTLVGRTRISVCSITTWETTQSAAWTLRTTATSAPRLTPILL